jgi:RNA polymerase sigma factor (sigma-70 family)
VKRNARWDHRYKSAVACWCHSKVHLIAASGSRLLIECPKSVLRVGLQRREDEATYERFADEFARPLKEALTASFGHELGDEATAEALAYGWEHWDRIRDMANPRGYLFRVGQNHAKGILRRRMLPVRRAISDSFEAWFEPELVPALRSLSEQQRTAVVLIHGFGWTITEVAELFGVTLSTVRSHLDRAMGKLRKRLGVDHV